MIQINKKIIDKDSPTYFIAEIGSNHDGSLERAKQLIDECVRIGADAVKFQSFSSAGLVAKDHPAFNALLKLELPHEWHIELSQYCEKKGIVFLSTPFDEEKVDWMEEAGVPAYKIASGDLTYYKLLARVARTGKPIILATGISELDEVKAAVRFIESCQNHNIAILHCVSNYPPVDSDLNINVIPTLMTAFPEYVVGLSDHSSEDIAVLGAVTLGARIVEKHITISRDLKGPDHPYALEVDEFGAMLKHVRRLEAMLGDAEKKPVAAELGEIKWARRGMYLKNDLPTGSVIKDEDLDFLRPNVGIGADKYRDIIGKELNVSALAGTALTPEMLN